METPAQFQLPSGQPFYDLWDHKLSPKAGLQRTFGCLVSSVKDQRNYLIEPLIKYLTKEGAQLLESGQTIADDTTSVEDDDDDVLLALGGEARNSFYRLYWYRSNLIAIDGKRDAATLETYYPATIDVVTGKAYESVIDEFKGFLAPRAKAAVSVLLNTQYGMTTKSVDFEPPKIDDLEMNYGTGFTKVHGQIVAKLKANKAQMLLFHGNPGCGKCLGKDTPILMYDGTICAVQDVKNGDLVMGPDSQPRLASGVIRGREKMFRIKPIKGESFVANESHILSLKQSGKEGGFINITIKDYLAMGPARKRLKLWRAGIDFTHKEIPLPAYFLGLWLGDGNSEKASVTTMDQEIVDYLASFAKDVGHDIYLAKGGCSGKANTWHLCGKRGRMKGGEYPFNWVKALLDKLGVLNNKHIPLLYKTNDRQIRLELLAGLIDSDGHLHDGHLDFTLVNERLARDLCYLARSLGLAAYIKKVVKCCKYKGEKRCGDYWRISISGDLEDIPTKLPQKRTTKRKQIKNVLFTGFEVEPLEKGDYYGFKVDGDGLFCLGDFTVTHNTFYIKYLTHLVDREFIFIPTGMAGELSSPSFLTLLLDHKNAVLVLEDAEQALQSREIGNGSVISTLLNISDGILGQLLNITIIATYNADKQTIDKALLRKGRLAYDYTFGPLSVADAKRLVVHLKKSGDPITEPTTLADIYNAEDDTGYVEPPVKTMGFLGIS